MAQLRSLKVRIYKSWQQKLQINAAKSSKLHILQVMTIHTPNCFEFLFRTLCFHILSFSLTLSPSRRTNEYQNQVTVIKSDWPRVEMLLFLLKKGVAG